MFAFIALFAIAVLSCGVGLARDSWKSRKAAQKEVWQETNIVDRQGRIVGTMRRRVQENEVGVEGNGSMDEGRDSRRVNSSLSTASTIIGSIGRRFRKLLGMLMRWLE